MLVDFTNTNITMNGIVLEEVQSTKFLGLIIDNKLTWDLHKKYVYSKISKNLGIIKKCKGIIDEKGTINMYKAFIQPYYLYGLEVWGHSISSATDILVTLQSKVLREVFDYKRSEDAWNHNSGRIQSIKTLYENVIKKLCIKHHFGILPKNFTDFVMPKLSMNILQRRISRTNLQHMYNYLPGKSEEITPFKTSCIKIWNNQPFEIKSAPYSYSINYVYHLLGQLETGIRYKR